MSENGTITGQGTVVRPEEGNGNVPALAIDAESEHGVVDIDLRGYSKVGHQHDEYLKKDENAGIGFDVLFEGDAHTVGQEVKLSRPMSDYKVIIMFTSVFSKANGFVHNDAGLLYPEDLVYNSENSLFTRVFNGGGYLAVALPSAGSFKIVSMNYQVNSNWNYFSVRRVIGIR